MENQKWKVNKENFNEWDYYKRTNPVCPNCQHECVEWWDYLNGDDGEEEEYECDVCGFKYVIEVHTSISFSSKLKEDLI